MKKYILMLGMGFFLSSMLQAHGSVVVKKNRLVIVKPGMSHHEKHMIMKCLLCLKKHKTREEAVEAYTGKIDEKCTKHNIADKKCKLMKAVALKRIDSCYTTAEFFKEFFQVNTDKDADHTATDTTTVDTEAAHND